MNTTIKVKAHSLKNGWFNVVTADGKEVSVLAEKNPKLKALLEANPDGNFDMPCSFVEKGGKNYAWDVKEQGTGGGGGWKGAAAKGGGTDESFCASYSKDIWVAKIQAKEQFSIDDCIKVADRLFDWMKSKKSAS